MRKLDLTILSTLIVIFCSVSVIVTIEFLPIMDVKNKVLAKNGRDKFQDVLKATKSNTKKGIMREYIVKQGDSLSGISKRFFGSGVEWEVIADANNIESPNDIQIGERLLVPFRSSKGYYQKGTASWYGNLFHGKETASGNIYDMYAYTAAHRNLPLGSKVRVINLRNGKDIIVKINDRGPYIKNRIIDLSYSAAKSLGIIDGGIQDVKIEVVSIPNV
ncbi:MAG: septal ring lytic transglycosylase RlpA family protein [Thermodesulfobacteriota bacterium]